MTAKVSPLIGQVLRKAELTNYAKTVEGSADSPVASVEDATVITSEVADTACFGGLHRPVLDIDMPVKVLPSSTSGHHHLLIDKEMTWQQYAYLLDALVTVGLIEPGYRDASVERGWSCVRLPWVRKNDPTNTPFVTNGDSWNGDDAFVMTEGAHPGDHRWQIPELVMAKTQQQLLDELDEARHELRAYRRGWHLILLAWLLLLAMFVIGILG